MASPSRRRRRWWCRRRRCWQCRWWRTHYPTGRCLQCDRESPVGQSATCRLCWEQARLLQEPGRAVDLVAAIPGEQSTMLLLERLKDRGAVYPCFCSKELLDQKRAARNNRWV